VSAEPIASSASDETGAHPADAQQVLDAQHPWLGLASFTEQTRGYFHGREEEVAELGRRVQRKLLTVLFGQSGLGKTSILRAGIVPRLRPEGYCPVYVRIDYSPESPPPSEQIKQAIFRATQSSGSWTQAGTAVQGESLWEFLHHRDDILRDANGKTLIPLLIFDQFEEIFTLAQADDAGRRRAAQFIDDLADLVENRAPKELEARLESDDSIVERFDFSRADYRILIALREDYLAHLEGVKGVMPSITQNRMRLARMNGQQALAAVMKPGGKLVTQEVAESIVRFIAGGAELRNAEVEPSLLSLICRELNNARIAQGRTEISADLLAGSHDTILSEFYERALADQPAAVRKAIEDQLLTESGYRESLAEERVLKAFVAAGAAPDALPTLVNRRLLRIEERLDVRRVELTHDVLCGVVKASREMRLAREAKEDAERQLAAQKAREDATRQALVRARRIAAGCAVLALLAVVSAVFGYLNMERARAAEAKALQTRQMAEQARSEAEKLMVYLLDDFTTELEPTGRLDIVAQLAQRALGYYKELPPELRTPETERNRALALVRYGAVLRSQGKYAQAVPLLEEATEVFRKLRADGDTSEATVLGLASALGFRSTILGQQLKLPESVTMGQAALDVLRPLAQAPEPSPAVLRVQGAVLIGQGFSTLRSGALEESVEHLKNAQVVLRRLGAPDVAKNIHASANYASAGSWLGSALEELEQRKAAKATFEETVAVTGRVLDVMPGHTRALHARGISLSALSAIDYEENRVARAMVLAQQDERTQEDLIKLDPTNTASLNNLAVARFYSFLYLDAAGRSQASCEKMRSVVAVAKSLPNMGSFTARNFSSWAGILANCEAELGNPAAAGAALSQASELWEKEIKPTSVAFETAVARLWIGTYRSYVLLANGDAVTSRDEARKALVDVDALEPPNKQGEFTKLRLRKQLNLGIAYAELQAGNAAGAEGAARTALAAWKPLPRNGPFGQEEDGAVARTLVAHAIARQGRLKEAGEFLAPALQYQRDVYGKQKENRGQHYDYAYALYVSAMAEPAERSARLAEATTILESLPPEMLRTKSGQRFRGWVEEERKKR
jgi:hypothetical protein